MIKGAQKQMIVLRTGSSRYFDEAYFVLRREVRAHRGIKNDILREAHRISWFTYNKPFGWEEHDRRYGGLAARFDTVKYHLAAYLAGKTAKIAELEEERLRIDGQPEDAPKIDSRFVWLSYPGVTKIGI